MPSGTNENVLFKFLVACGSLPGGHCVNSTTEAWKPQKKNVPVSRPIKIFVPFSGKSTQLTTSSMQSCERIYREKHLYSLPFMTTSLMDPLHIIMPLLWGAVSCSFNWTSASVSEVTVRRGDNITLYCDCKMGDGELTVWFRNCSNENHTVLVLTAEAYFQQFGKTRFIWTKNISSDSYDLTIINVTYSDEGFYYCANEKNKVEDKKQVNVRSLYNYSSIIRKISVSTDFVMGLKPANWHPAAAHTPVLEKVPQMCVKEKVRGCGRKLLDSNRPHNCTSDSQQNDDVCWKLLFFSVCPAVSVLSALLSVLVYRICQKSATSSQNSERKENSRNLTRHTQEQDEDVCYAALEIQKSSMKPQRKRTTQTFDLSTYSTVNT
ncbi:uncharacterized protein LOC144981372 isoform X2 [Oryzias latipes]